MIVPGPLAGLIFIGIVLAVVFPGRRLGRVVGSMLRLALGLVIAGAVVGVVLMVLLLGWVERL